MKRPKMTKPFFKAAMRPDGVLELLVYEDIGYDWWTGEGLTAKTVKTQLDEAGAYSRILVRINSPGCDAFEGVAIGNLLKSTGKPIDVAVDGIAASAASIIAMCGSTITMASNAMMMIHNAWAMCMGNANDMTKMADILGKIDEAIALTYVERTGKTTADIKARMDEETWMSAADCLKDGFCTAIAMAEDPEKEKAALAMARSFKVMEKFKKVPPSLGPQSAVEPECQCECQACQDGDDAACTNIACDDPNCVDCPMQAKAEEKAARAGKLAGSIIEPELETAPPSNLNRIQCEQWMLEHGV